MDLNKWKVNDLKTELAARNLDTKGVKNVLVDRLKEAMEGENAGSTLPSTPVAAAALRKPDVAGTPGQSTPIRRSRRRSMTKSPSPVRTEAATPLDSVSEVAEPEESAEPAKLPSPSKKRRTVDAAPEDSEAPPGSTAEVTATTTTTPTKATEQKLPANSPVKRVSLPAAAAAKVVASPAKTNDESRGDSEVPAEDDAEVSNVASNITTCQINEESFDASAEGAAEPAAEGEDPAGDDPMAGEAEATDKEAAKKAKKATLTPIDFVAEEQEPEMDGDRFGLNWYDSHLNLEIDPATFDSAKPISEGALALVWAAARANLGVTQGKVAYEVSLSSRNTTKQVTDEPVTSGFRVGWSVASANLELGEAPCSFAFDSEAKKGTDSKFEEYGGTYDVNDVVGVYLDLDANPCTVEFTLNGVSQGVAFEFTKESLKGQALFPHVCSRNVAFKVNFGQLERSLLNDRVIAKEKEVPPKEEKSEETATTEANSESGAPEKPAEAEKTEETAPEEPARELQTIKQDFTYVGKSAKEHLTQGIGRVASRSDCEVIFTIGMPASGKTHWVQNFLKEQEQKRYTILSVDTLLNQMKLHGTPREPSNTKQWSKLVDQLSKSLCKLDEIAAKRRRNFILDQTNVFFSEQKRRLRGFGEYAARKAIVLVPSEEEYARRLKLKQDAFGVEVLEPRVNIMKANFFIPTLEQGWFTEMTFAEQDEEKTRETVQKLNEAGKLAHPRGANRNQQNRRGAGSANNFQRRNQGFGNNRYGGGQQYQAGRYHNQQQYPQNRNYRPGGSGYGRRDGYGGGPANYGNGGWMRNDPRSQNNRRYGNSYGGGYNGGNSGWNQQYYSGWGNSGGWQNNDQQWNSWWQSNGKNVLQQSGANPQQMEQYWSQYAQQHNYRSSHPHQSKANGAPKAASKNK